MADNTQQTDVAEKNERNKYVIGLAKQNLTIVIDQIESIDSDECKGILKALESVKTDMEGIINGG